MNVSPREEIQMAYKHMKRSMSLAHFPGKGKSKPQWDTTVYLLEWLKVEKGNIKCLGGYRATKLLVLLEGM